MRPTHPSELTHRREFPEVPWVNSGGLIGGVTRLILYLLLYLWYPLCLVLMGLFRVIVDKHNSNKHAQGISQRASLGIKKNFGWVKIWRFLRGKYLIFGAKRRRIVWVKKSHKSWRNQKNSFRHSTFKFRHYLLFEKEYEAIIMYTANIWFCSSKYYWNSESRGEDWLPRRTKKGKRRDEIRPKKGEEEG